MAPTHIHVFSSFYIYLNCTFGRKKKTDIFLGIREASN